MKRSSYVGSPKRAYLFILPIRNWKEHTVCRAGQAGIGSCAIRRKTKKPERMLRLK
nr:MAG TPA: hypothetical protein [Caudoviricetes sp.]